MRLMFGGRRTSYDVHYSGLNYDFLPAFLKEAGFEQIRKVEALNCFNDTSSMLEHGVPISLNVVARKPA
jgi:hypothetical protein